MNTQTNSPRDIVQILISRIEAELSLVDREAAFNAMLDDCYSFEKVGGPFAYMSPSSVLKEVDPTAYRCGVNDFADGEGWVEVNGETYDQEEVERITEEFKDEMQDELGDLEEELETEQGEDEPDEETVSRLQQLIAEKQSEIATIEKDNFFN